MRGYNTYENAGRNTDNELIESRQYPYWKLPNAVSFICGFQRLWDSQNGTLADTSVRLYISFGVDVTNGTGSYVAQLMKKTEQVIHRTSVPLGGVVFL